MKRKIISKFMHLIVLFKKKYQIFCYQAIILFRKTTEINGIKFDISSLENYQRAKNLLTKEIETINWIDSFDPNDIFYDIGANIGAFSLYSSTKCKQVLAFEPHFMNYDILNKNIHLNEFKNVKAYCLAFSDQMEIGTLEHYKISAGSSTSQFNKTTDHLGQKFKSRFSQGMISLSLDDFISKVEDNVFPSHIKIDVDGLEENIISQMERTLKNPRLKSILIEITEIEETGDRIREILNSHNFTVFKTESTSNKTANYTFTRTESNT
jgi:FkbM family methyltransferase